jgi:hypothetical protein
MVTINNDRRDVMKKLVTIVILITLLLMTVSSALVVSAQTEEPTVTVEPTEEPTAEPTEELIVEPTEEPTAEPTEEPTVEPTEEPTVEPTEEPTEEPTVEPTEEPTEEPTVEPTEEPTVEPTEEPTVEPTEEPTVEPTEEPTEEPTVEPTEEPTVTPRAIDAQGDFNPGSGVSKIAVMNVDPNANPAAYSVAFYDQRTSGGTDDTTTLANPSPLAYRAAAYYDLSAISVVFGTGWIGSAVISSQGEMFAAVDNTYTGGDYTGGDGYNGEAYEAPETSTDIFMPYGTRLGIYRFSRITIQGTKTTGTTTVNLTYRDQNGNDATCTNPTTANIEASRSYSFEPVFNCGGNTDNGSMRITSTSDPVVVTFDGSWGEYAGWKTAYSGIPATKASDKLYYPNIFRRVPSGDWVQWSNLFVQNVTNTDVVVNINLYATGAANPSMTISNVTIPAYSAKEWNTRFGASPDPTPSPGDFNALGDLFAGTAIVERVSGPNNALVGVAHNFWGHYFFGGSTYTAFSANDGADTLYVPFSARKQAGGNWTQWDKISFMNISGSSVQVDVKYYDGNGNVVLDLTGTVGPITVPNLSVDSINTQYGCDSGVCSPSHLNPLGDSFEGTIVIEAPSGSKLVGIMNTLYPNRLNTFNAKAKNR